LDAYNKWLDNTSEYFTSYEVELLELFNLRWFQEYLVIIKKEQVAACS
jgi:hypothetical protein